MHAELAGGSLRLERCRVTQNHVNPDVVPTDAGGGGIFCSAALGVELVDCLVAENSATGFCNTSNWPPLPRAAGSTARAPRSR